MDANIKFKDWKGQYALFEIMAGGLPDGSLLERIIVAHEGKWIEEDGMICHPEFQLYEDVQKKMGTGLFFKGKEYSDILNRSIFEFSVKDYGIAMLAVPATGEEISFEVYGSSKKGPLHLLLSQEL